MSTATLGVTAGVDSALRRAFSEASVRLQPEARLSELITALEALGIAVEITDGVLVLRQGDTMMHTALALRSLVAKPEFKKFFVYSTDDPKTWTLAEKQNYIRQNGADAYGKLLAKPVLDAGIKTLDPNMSKSDYLNLTTKEKVVFCREYGDEAVRKVMRKAK